MQEDNHSIMPYAWTEEYNIIVTSAGADRQLMRASWPLNLTARLLSMRISNTDASSGGQVVLWDQDLSNTSQATRGSAGGFLAIAGAAPAATSGTGATTTEWGRDGGPTPEFYAGIAFQATKLNMHVSAQVLHHY